MSLRVTRRTHTHTHTHTTQPNPTNQVWDAASRALVATHAFDDTQLGDMQNGLLWLEAGTLATVSLNGDINIIADPAAAASSQPGAASRRAVHGHQVRGGRGREEG